MKPEDDPYAAERKVERDKRAARTFREKPRYAVDASKLVKSWMRGPELRRIRTFQKINTVLEQVFDQRILAFIKAQRLAKGKLTIVVNDSVLLSEMKNVHDHRLLTELIHAGTGVTEIVYRLNKS